MIMAWIERDHCAHGAMWLPCGKYAELEINYEFHFQWSVRQGGSAARRDRAFLFSSPLLIALVGSHV